MHKDLEKIFNQSPLLSTIDIKKINTTKYNFKNNQIIDSNFFSSSIGVISKGSVAVYSISIDGNEVLLNILNQGDYFGISDIYNNESIKTSLNCISPVEIIFISKIFILNELSINEKFNTQYIKVLNNKIQFLLNRVELLTMQTSKNKLIAYLLSNCINNKYLILDISKEDLARHLGISRSALFRELTNLQKKSLIEIKDKKITILDIINLKKSI
ncbi:MAG: Crp/Fnr family transcriptional regulator [Bacilli bacterium]